MKALLTSQKSQKIRRGLFNIDLNLPGLELNNIDDPRGLAQLGRFDFAHLHPGVFVGMHLHQNDEILTYIREGEMLHEDNHGKTKLLSNKTIMMMNAGKGFYHQESIPEDGTDVKLLQIFLRPAKKNGIPQVQFHEFIDSHSINKLRLIAGYQNDAPLKVNTEASVWDIRLENGKLSLPNMLNKTYLLFIFSNSILINDSTTLYEGDSYIYENEEIEISTNDVSDLVLFELDKNKTYIRTGMFSGT